MQWASVEGHVVQMWTAMASVMTVTFVWVRSTLAAYAMVLARYTRADVRTFRPATAIAMETKSMRLASVEALALRMWMATAFVTMATLHCFSVET
jgi:hypothetical protein